MKSGNLNFVEPSGPLQACNGTDLPFTFTVSFGSIKYSWPTRLRICTRSGNLGVGPYLNHDYGKVIFFRSRSQWPRVLRRGSAAARLLRLRVRIPPGIWMSVCYECCVLSSRGLCVGLITRPEESYRLWCVVVCDLETSSRMRRPWPASGCSARGKKSVSGTSVDLNNLTQLSSWYSVGFCRRESFRTVCKFVGFLYCVRKWSVVLCVSSHERTNKCTYVRRVYYVLFVHQLYSFDISIILRNLQEY